MTNQRTLAHSELILLLGFLLSLLFRKELKNTESMKPVRTLLPNSLNYLYIQILYNQNNSYYLFIFNSDLVQLLVP